jgi:TPR repeat protein
MRTVGTPTGLVLIAVLVVVASAAPARGQHTNAPTQPATNVGQFQPKPAVAAGGVTNSQQKFTPPSTNFTLLSSNSIAFQETKARAEQGDAKAQFDLAMSYNIGIGVPQDDAESAKWYRKGAEQGDATAQCFLGVFYAQGRGVPQNDTEAAKWYRKAAEQGNAPAQYEFGFCFTEGEGVPQDYAEAAKWYRKAAEQGDARAQYSLGLCYAGGLGVPQDDGEAVKWYRKAVEQGNTGAQFRLGVCYEIGQGVPQDYAEAVKWYRKAAEGGDVTAQFNLGVFYAQGRGVPQNDTEAAKWYRKAAERGDAWAQGNLATCYLNGTGVPKDALEAVRLLRPLAESGNSFAQGKLGFCYEIGEGVPKDSVEAYKWYNLAAAQGYEKAAKGRSYLEKLDMTPEQIAEGQRLAREFVPRKESGASKRADGQDAVALGNLPRFTGTGFFVTDDGCLLTSYHVVEDAARIAIRTKAGTLAATLVKADKANDVALLKVTGMFSALPVASSRGVKLGESVFTIGFPNIELQGFAPKLTKGEISSSTGVQDDPREFQISVAVQPGNSGGPLVNQYGNVVGIVEARLADVSTLETTGALPQNVNYAMKSSVLNVLLESLPEVSAKLPEPHPSEERKFEDVEKETESAVVLVLVY